MMAFHKPAIVLAATLAGLALGTPAPAVDLTNDQRAQPGRSADRITSTDSQPMSERDYGDAVKSANDVFDEKFKACGEFTGNQSLVCRNEARAMRDRAMASIWSLRNPAPAGGERK